MYLNLGRKTRRQTPFFILYASVTRKSVFVNRIMFPVQWVLYEPGPGNCDLSTLYYAVLGKARSDCICIHINILWNIDVVTS